MAMTLEQQQEAFSQAFARAVCAVAGFAVSKPEPDVDSVDLIVKGRSRQGAPAQVDLQLKCKRSASPAGASKVLKYPLDNLKNYNELRDTRVIVPIILVVVLVPDQPQGWFAMDDDQLVLSYCAYWCSLWGAAPTENKKSKTIDIPISQRFNPEALVSMMEHAARHERVQNLPLVTP